MASEPGSQYFPPLGQCLTGQNVLFSWKSIFAVASELVEVNTGRNAIELVELTDDVENIRGFLGTRNLNRYISEVRTATLLRKPWEAFSPPNAHSKSVFQTKTAAVNVTPATNGNYNLAEIREDTLHLSQSMKIDEISALRIVVLEFQSRAQNELLLGMREEEAASLSNIMGAFSSVSMSAGILSPAKSDEEYKKFNSQEARRDRIVRTYLSEREYLVKTSGLLYQLGLHQHRLTERRGEGRTENSVLALLGSFVTANIAVEELLTGLLNTLEAKLKELNGENPIGDEESMGVDYIRCVMTEIISYMEITFEILDSLVEIPSTKIALRWFQIFAPCDFLDQATFPDVLQGKGNHMKCLLAIISVAMLKLSNSLRYLQEPQNVLTSDNADNTSNFVLDDDAILAIHGILLECAKLRTQTTSPAVFAWSIFLQTIKVIVAEFAASSDDGFESDDSGTEQGDSPPHGSRRRAAIGRESLPQVARYQEILEKIYDSSVADDPISFMAESAVCAVEGSGDVGRINSLLFDLLTGLGVQIGRYDADGVSGILASRLRAIILDLIALGLPMTTYSNTVVNASLAALMGGQQYWDLLEAPKLANAEDPVLSFLENEALMEGLFDVAANRQPYERSPFLKFALAIAASRTQDSDGNPAGGSMLDNREAFTHTLPREFRDFETRQEEDNTNLIALTRPIQIFGLRRAPQLLSITQGSEEGSHDQFTIPAGTLGRMVSENTEPRIVVWFHSYSGYTYLGKILETQLVNSEFTETAGETVDEESVADIIDIFATLLLSCTKLENPQQAAQHILEKASEGLSRTHDIINVIFDLLEHDLDIRSVSTGFHNFLGISVASLHFLHALMHFMPGRVWPFLARSRLLDTDGQGSKLSEIVTGTEIVKGQFDFLLSSIHLFDSLVEDATSNVVLRRGVATTSLVRHGNLQDFGAGVPDQGLIRVINQFTGLLIDVFSSIHNWKIRLPEEYLQLFDLIGKVFTKMIRYVYGIDNAPEPDLRPRLVSPLQQAARRIADCFLSTAPGNLHVQVILHSFIEGYAQVDISLEPFILTLYHGRVSSIFRLTIVLLKLRTMLELPLSQLETKLFSAVPLLVRLYAAHDSYRPLVLTLLKELVTGASDNTGEPPSLIGHLRLETTKGFLTMLSNLDRPSESDDQVSLIWQFLSAVVSNRQRTLAIILLTGKTPRQALRNNDDSSLLENPFLSVALDTLSATNFDTARSRLDPSPPLIAILEFVAQAQDFWPLQMGRLHNHPNFIQSISTWVQDLEPLAANRAEEHQQLAWCYCLRMASLVAEILAMYLYRCREMGNMAPVRDIIPKLRFFKEHGVAAPNYNKSLHGNLQRNFERKHPGLNLLMFKKTRLEKRALGPNYFYDIVLSNKMLRHDEAWEGRRGDGQFSEFIRANINLSIVDAQIALLHGWKFLAIELRNSVTEYPDLQRIFAKISTECLVANKQDQPPEHIFDRLMQNRTDFALMAMQTLLDTQAKNLLAPGARPAVKHVLNRVWETVQNLRENLDLAMSVGDAQYYRSLLKLLYLSLQAHAPTIQDGANGTDPNANVMKPSASTEIAIALEVTNHVVARGFRELAIAIHDRASECSPEDILLLTNILAACLRIPKIEFCHDQIINHMVNNEAPRVAVTLFSWSDRLAINGDPIYGELSILFLLEISKMKLMAEQIAVDGVLGQISSAGLANYLRRGNVSPFAEGVGPQRCYDIWVRGILPLLLNLLFSVGSLIGAEVAIFLNQFTPLLQSSLKGLEPNDSNRTMSGIVLKPVISRVVSEINTLALINHILKDYRFALSGVSEIPEVPGLTALDKNSKVLENAEFWLASRQLLRERIMPMGQKEIELSKQKAVAKGNGCENRLEEKIVEELMGIRDILTPVNGDA